METYILLDENGLQLYDTLLKEYVDGLSDLAIKAAKIEGTKLKLYTTEIIDEAEPACELDIPQQDLSNLLEKLSSPTKDNIVVAGDEGAIADSGVAIGSVVKKSDVVDNLESMEVDVPLSANQGNVLNKALESANAEIAELSGNYDTISGKVDDLTSGLTTAQQGITKLGTDLASTNTKIEKVEKEINTLTDTTTGIVYKLSVDGGLLCLDDGKE